MGELKLQNILYSVEEYFSIDAQSEDRYEYHAGYVRAMAGTTTMHNLIIQNLVVLFRAAIKNKGRKCKIFTENVRLELPQKKAYYYPDLMFTCNPLDLQEKNMVHAPTLIIEVLSESSFAIDLSQKVDNYIMIPSLLYYIVISQSEYRLRVWEKVEKRWVYSVYTELSDKIDLPQIDICLSLEELYENVFGEI